VSNLPTDATIKTLAATIKARWDCEQAHQQLKEELGLDHFEGRSWTGLHRHALMTMIAYAFLQHRRLAQAGRKKNQRTAASAKACRRYATPSSISSFDRQLSDAHTSENESVKSYKSICQSTARMVTGDGIHVAVSLDVANGAAPARCCSLT
jgi:hypothetical protein